MGFSVKQVRALKRNPDHRHIVRISLIVSGDFTRW